MESAKDAGNKVVDTAKEIVEHPILSVEHGYEAVKEKVIDASEGIKAAVKKSSEKWSASGSKDDTLLADK